MNTAGFWQSYMCLQPQEKFAKHSGKGWRLGRAPTRSLRIIWRSSCCILTFVRNFYWGAGRRSSGATFADVYVPTDSPSAKFRRNVRTSVHVWKLLSRLLQMHWKTARRGQRHSVQQMLFQSQQQQQQQQKLYINIYNKDLKNVQIRVLHAESPWPCSWCIQQWNVACFLEQARVSRI